MKKYQNLHSHTTTSDGKITYQETLNICHENNTETVAFTDHDSLPSEKSIKTLQSLRSHPVKWIIGIEISSDLPRELGKKPISNFHIVGLFVNPLDKDLKKYCQRKQAARIERMQKIVKNLQILGFKIKEKDCLRESKGKTIGRPHIVSALEKNPENLKTIKEFKSKMEKEGKKNKKIGEGYKKMVAIGSQDYPYTLFLREDSYIKGIYVKHLYCLDFDHSVKLIRNAGGKAFLAHWSFYKHKVNPSLVEKFFKEKRIDGAEIAYPFEGTESRKQSLQDMEEIKKLTQKYDLLQSGGSDAHTKENIINFFKDKEIAPKTCNLVQRMIETGKINTTWSSI